MSEADGSTLVRCGRLVDVAAGEILSAKAIVVRGERVDAIVHDDGSVPSGAAVVDLREHTVVPGLIDCHAHLVGALEFSGVPSIQDSEARETLLGVSNARAALRAGFTSVRDVGTFRAFIDVELRDAIAEGIIEGPRMACAGAYVTSTSGGGEIAGLSEDVTVGPRFRVGVADSEDEVRRAVRRILHGGADFIKVIATGAVLTRGGIPGAPEFSEGEIRAAVEEAALYDTYVAAHAHGAEGIKRAVRAGVRSIEHGSLIDDDSIELMRDSGTYLVADIYNGDYIAEVGRREGWPEDTLRKNDETTDAQREGFSKAVVAGVKIAYGTDSGIFPHGETARQLPYMVRYGMTPVGAVRSATVVAAELMGWSDRVGSLEPGLFADLVAIRGHELGDLSAFAEPALVMKSGRVVRGNADELSA
ncbi:MAG TPA: amidohydrolase family protein [Actinomycetota bacterium]|nr:amidohydrolase family protein [Actinomycetota bacterium]